LNLSIFVPALQKVAWPSLPSSQEQPQATSLTFSRIQLQMDLSTLPASFNQFLKDNDVDPVIYTVKNLPRFVRWNTRFPKSELPTAEDLQQQLNARRVWPVKGVDGFFGIELEDNQPDSESESDTIQNTRIVDIPA
jgi:hypothetical protein